MNTVTVKINITTAKGRKLVQELQTQKEVEIEISMPEGNFYTLDEVYENGLDKLSAHYGVDMRKLKSELE